jgi:hypothetical protein
MDLNERYVELIGFGEFVLILERGREDEIKDLRGPMGKTPCSGSPQRYYPNSRVLENQKIGEANAQFLRDTRALPGDSGAPVFLEDGRVAGMVLEVDVSRGTETKIVPAGAIVKWLINVLSSNESLHESWYSLKAWAASNGRKLYDALNPDKCLSYKSCIPNLRIAAELDKKVESEMFSKEELRRLNCPIYTAASTRGIRQADGLRDMLKQRGVVTVQNVVNDVHTMLANTKYTVYNKYEWLNDSEAIIARNLDDALMKEPLSISEAICRSGVSTEKKDMIQSAVADYLKNFRPADDVGWQPIPGECPLNRGSWNPYANALNQIKGLTVMLSDVKVHQSELAAKSGNRSNAAVSAAALSAIVNAGDKQGTGALIDLGDAFLRSTPRVAADLYAKAFETEPTPRAAAGFADAVSRSPRLQERVGKQVKPASKTAIKGFISSGGTINRDDIAGMIADPGLRPGAAATLAASAVDLKPKEFPLTVLGVKTEVPMTISFDSKTEGDAIALQLRAHASLKGIQDQALDIARAIAVPRGNCDRNGINPVVTSIDSASITPVGTNAVVTMSGHVAAWVCEHPFGATVKTIVASDGVTLTVPVQIIVIDQKQIGLRLAGPISVTTGHALTADVVNLLAGDINASITSQLANALDAREARADLPDLQGLVANIQSAQFVGEGSELLVRAAGTARMSGEAFNRLLELMSK